MMKMGNFANSKQGLRKLRFGSDITWNLGNLTIGQESSEGTAHSSIANIGWLFHLIRGMVFVEGRTSLTEVMYYIAWSVLPRLD